jgi:uncharacterized protein YbcI
MSAKLNQTSLNPSMNTDMMQMLKGLRILVVEDVGMVAMSLKAMLQELGCVVVGTAARLHEVEELARHETLDGVLLDLNLAGQYTFPVADILRERNIPFIIMSGYDAGQLRPDLAEVPQMEKPFDRVALEPMLCKVFSPREEGGRSAFSSQPEQPTQPARKPPMKTQGELEAAVCLGMCQFQQEYLGRGPSDVRAHLIGELLVVRLQGILTAAELHLIENCPTEHGRELLKQMRTLLIETARLQIDSMIQLITGVKVISMHHDLSTITGEQVVIFTLNEAPSCRRAKI